MNTQKRLRKPELLIPAGSLNVLKVAVLYGADAVYIGGEAYGRCDRHDDSDRLVSGYGGNIGQNRI